MDASILEKVLAEAQKRVADNTSSTTPCSNEVVTGSGHTITEFVGTAMGDTIGLVIANLDPQLHDFLEIDKKYRSIGFLSARTGGAPHIM